MKLVESLDLVGISKTFPGVQANKEINLHLERGEIVALLGENGAGKSTLMNILSGIILPDSGQILLNGKEVRIRNPKDAIDKGVGMVHQHFMLIPTMTVAENIAFGLSSLDLFFPLKRVSQQIKSFSQSYGFDIPPRAKIWQLSIGQQQRVEILRVLMQGADVLILDEPTSVLTPQEAEDLFQILRKMKNEGHMVLFITHKLDEIQALCDRVVILRKGQVVGEGRVIDFSNEDLAQAMVGKNLDLSLPERTHAQGENLLEVENISIKSIYGTYAVRDLSFFIREHEILGIAGVSGNGQKELAESLAGLVPIDKGSIKLSGKLIRDLSPKKLMLQGVAHIPEERLSFGIVPNMMIYENTALKEYDQPIISPRSLLSISRMKALAGTIISRFNVSTPSVKTLTKSLSGGNIQKLILGREIARNPRLIIAAHPTYGLDIAATQAIRKELLEKREEGSAILLISEDLEELMVMSDRIAVMYKGEIRGILDRSEATVEELGLMMTGSKSREAPS